MSIFQNKKRQEKRGSPEVKGDEKTDLKAYLSLLLLRSGKDSKEKFKNSKHEGPNPFVR